MRGSSQSGRIPLKDRNGATSSNAKRVKKRWAEHFENVLSRDTVAGKDTDNNEKKCDTLEVKEDLFYEKELAIVLKQLKIIRVQVLIVWQMSFLHMVALRLENKQLKIMNMIFEKREVPNDFRKTLIKPLYKKDDKSECLNY